MASALADRLALIGPVSADRFCNVLRGKEVCIHLGGLLGTLGPLIIESLWAKERVSTRALGPLDNPLWSKRKFERAVEML